MRPYTDDEIRRIVLTVQGQNPGAHAMTVAYEARQRFGIAITGRQVERILRHQSTDR